MLFESGYCLFHCDDFFHETFLLSVIIRSITMYISLYRAFPVICLLIFSSPELKGQDELL